MSKLCANSIFKEALAEIKLINVHMSAEIVPGAQSYAVIGGRSNARWWLIPLDNGRVAASGFALFQPLLASARLMKLAVYTLSLLGLSRLWVRQKVYLSGAPTLDQYFPEVRRLVYAYFTGTNSPHRKVAIQVMDAKGRIMGFAKLSRKSDVAVLLQYEAEILQKIRALKLETAYVPKVLFAGMLNGGHCLLTDTLKTPLTRSVTTFGEAHKIFLQELSARTAMPECTAAEAAGAFSARIEQLHEQLDACWSTRLKAAIVALAGYGSQALPQCLSHGDFTPWNTFIVSGRLYVFDWEYAELVSSPGNDIIHFVLNQPGLHSKSAEKKVAAARAALSEAWTGLGQNLVSPLLLIYLLTLVLRQIERLPVNERQHGAWDGTEEQAGMMDLILTEITVKCL